MEPIIEYVTPWWMYLVILVLLAAIGALVYLLLQARAKVPAAHKAVADLKAEKADLAEKVKRMEDNIIVWVSVRKAIDEVLLSENQNTAIPKILEVIIDKKIWRKQSNDEVMANAVQNILESYRHTGSEMAKSQKYNEIIREMGKDVDARFEQLSHASRLDTDTINALKQALIDTAFLCIDGVNACRQIINDKNMLPIEVRKGKISRQEMLSQLRPVTSDSNTDEWAKHLDSILHVMNLPSGTYVLNGYKFEL